MSATLFEKKTSSIQVEERQIAIARDQPQTEDVAVERDRTVEVVGGLAHLAQFATEAAPHSTTQGHGLRCTPKTVTS